MQKQRETGTTIWLDRLTSKKIKELAIRFRRSKAGQIRWMLDQELNRLAQEEINSSSNGSDCEGES